MPYEGTTNIASDGRTPEKRRLAEIKEEVARKEYQERKGNTIDDTPDHLSVGMCINLLRNDANQLLQEIEELRARLSPLLSEPKTERVSRSDSRTLVRCELAGELEAIHSSVATARENIYYTLAQLDL